MFVGLFDFEFVTPSPSISLSLFIVYGWLCFLCFILGLKPGSQIYFCVLANYSLALLFLYLCLSDYLDYDLSLSVYDLCLAPLKLCFLVHCASGSSLTFTPSQERYIYGMVTIKMLSCDLTVVLIFWMFKVLNLSLPPTYSLSVSPFSVPSTVAFCAQRHEGCYRNTQAG